MFFENGFVAISFPKTRIQMAIFKQRHKWKMAIRFFHSRYISTWNMVLVFLSFKYGLKRFLKHEQLRWITTGERKVKLFKRREGSDGGHITSGRTWPYTLPYDEWKVTTEATESSQENFIGPIITTYMLWPGFPLWGWSISILEELLLTFI